MSDQKYRADCSAIQDDGAVVWRSRWQSGLPVAKVEKCRLENMVGDMRVTAYATGEADTFFSVPAVCRLMGKRVKGYLTGDDAGNLVFRQVYY